MIVLRHIDLLAGQAEFIHSGEIPADWEERISGLVEVFRSLQLSEISVGVLNGALQRRFTLRNPELVPGRKQDSESAATVAVQTEAASHLLWHRWTLLDGCPIYDVRFLHAMDGLSELSRYVGLLLATYGHPKSHLTQLHIAVHEICANIIEHGQRIADAGHLDVHLELGEGEIRGWVQDTCKWFDPTMVQPARSTQLAASRLRRGYGITLIQALLDTLHHDFNSIGNRITFSKGISK